MRKERSSKLWLTIPPDVDVPVRISESVAKLGNPREKTIFDRVDSGLGNMKKEFGFGAVEREPKEQIWTREKESRWPGSEHF